MRHGKSSLSSNESGVTLLMVAASLVIMLGMCALSIDLVAGYLARVQCQRAADAGALAGAKAFQSSGCTTTGCVPGSATEALARQNAIAVAAQNPVMGLAPSDTTVDTAFDYNHDVLTTGGSGEPQITVTVYRDSVHNDAMPTFFAKIFGINFMDISASATAEAFNPGGTGTNVGVRCVKPFIVPNCDPNFPVLEGTAGANSNCHCGGTGVINGDCPSGFSTGYDMSYYVDPSTGTPLHPSDCVWDSNLNQCQPSSGDIGAPWVLHNSDSGAPSQWYTIAFNSQSGMEYSQYIRECAPNSVACWGTLSTLNGKKVGPTDAGIDCLIHSCGSAGCSGQCPATGVANNLPDGLNNGQDYMCAPYVLPGAQADAFCPKTFNARTSPFAIVPGYNSPYYKDTSVQTFYATNGGSDSIANVVLYDGAPLSSGGSTVTVHGYMSIFIQDALHDATGDTINAVIVDVGGCGTGGSASTPDVNSAGGGSFIPIRLIHN